jgi:hypothetical protein
MGLFLFAAVPQTINNSVPAESIAAYRAAEGWKDFGNIVAIE